MLESGVVPDGRILPPLFELATDAAVTGEAKGDRFGLAIPLVGPSGVIAVVVAFGVTRDPVTDQIVRLLSSEFGGRLEQLRLLEALGEQTLRDALTGVGSRRHADALVEGLQPGDSLLLIDVDHFKHVNDTRGHLGGDRLLEQLGSHLRGGLRDHDAVARYGGDEFLVRLHTHDGDSQRDRAAPARHVARDWRRPDVQRRHRRARARRRSAGDVRGSRPRALRLEARGSGAHRSRLAGDRVPQMILIASRTRAA